MSVLLSPPPSQCALSIVVGGFVVCLFCFVCFFGIKRKPEHNTLALFILRMKPLSELRFGLQVCTREKGGKKSFWTTVDVSWTLNFVA